MNQSNSQAEKSNGNSSFQPTHPTQEIIPDPKVNQTQKYSFKISGSQGELKNSIDFQINDEEANSYIRHIKFTQGQTLEMLIKKLGRELQRVTQASEKFQRREQELLSELNLVTKNHQSL